MELADFREILVEIRILTVDLVELLGKFECTSGRVSSNEESEIPQIFRLRRFQWNFTSINQLLMRVGAEAPLVVSLPSDINASLVGQDFRPNARVFQPK